MRFCSAIPQEEEEEEEEYHVWSATDILEMKPKQKKEAQFSSTVNMETFPPASFLSWLQQLVMFQSSISQLLLLPIYPV